MTADAIRDALLEQDAPLLHEATLAATLYGEARNQPLDGIVAVANVIQHRVAAQTWFGKTIAEVCLKPAQFSCWWGTDANVLAVYDLAETFLLSPSVTQRPRAELMRMIAKLTLGDLLVDAAAGANHYCRTDVVESTAWARGKIPTIVLGDHSFFRL